MREMDYGQLTNPQITVTFSQSEPHESLIAHLRVNACVVVGFPVLYFSVRAVVGECRLMLE